MRRISTGSDETKSAGPVGGIDAVTPTVNHDVMVKPTERSQIVRVGRSPFGPSNDVMWLQAVSTGATVGRTSAVPMEDEATETIGDDPAPTPDPERAAVQSANQLETPSTGNFVEDLGTDFGRPGYLGSRVVDEHSDQGSARTGWAGVLAEGCQSDRPPIPETGSGPIRQRWDLIGDFGEDLLDHTSGVTVQLAPQTPSRLVEIGLHG